MRYAVPLITLLLSVTYLAVQPPTDRSLLGIGHLLILLLPPPNAPANNDAQEAVVTAARSVWQKVLGGWTVVTFHKESPSLLRARSEGKLPEAALTQPQEYADKLCAVEGAKAALWLRVTRSDEKMPQAIEGMLLFPSKAQFSADLQEQKVTDDEKQALSPLMGKAMQVPNDLLLALRLGKWLQTQLAMEPPQPSPALALDPKTAAELVAAGKLEEATQVLSALIADNPTNPRLYLQLGEVYERRGRFDDAALEYRRATQLQGDFWEAWKGIARTAAKRARWNLALDAVRRLRQLPAKEPAYLALGAQAATALAADAMRRGRDHEREAFLKEAAAFDEGLIQATDDPKLLLDAAERLVNARQGELAIAALQKALPKFSSEPNLSERVIIVAVSLKRPDIAYQSLVALVSKGEYAPSREQFSAFLTAMDAEAVRLFERVRDSVTDFDMQKLTRDDMMVRLQQLNADADRLLRTAHSIKPPEAFAKVYDRRLLSYDLFLQATVLLMQWVETQEDLIRRRAVIYYEFARMELEGAVSEERKIR